jgi:putative glutamine amidotransferase
MVRIGVTPRWIAPNAAGSGSERKPRTAFEKSVNRMLTYAGGIPFGLPLLTELHADARSRALDGIVNTIDGLLLQGGTDVEPKRFGESPMRPEWAGDALRDALEFDLLERFLRAGKPVLAICRGIQVLNVALGGDLYQDLPTQLPTSTVVHNDSHLYDKHEHDVVLVEGGALHTLYDRLQAPVTSAHHQALRKLAATLIEEAHSADGVVEAVRDPRAHFVLGVQWHPEFHSEDRPHLLGGDILFRAFIGACSGART